MKKISAVLAILMALAMVLTMVGCAKEEEKSKIDQIKEAGVLVVGTSADYPPFEFHTEIDGEDTIVGAEIALAQYFADSLGVELKVVDMNFDSLVAALADGDFDIVAATMKPSEKRKEVIDFTESWYQNQIVAVVRVENADMFKNPEDLAGYKVAAQTGTAPLDYAVEYAGEENAVGLAKVQNLILEVQEGKVDAALMEGLPAEAYCAAHDDLVVVDINMPKSGENAAIGVQKGNEELVEYLSGLIKEVLENGKMDEFIAEAGALAIDVE